MSSEICSAISRNVLKGFQKNSFMDTKKFILKFLQKVFQEFQYKIFHGFLLKFLLNFFENFFQRFDNKTLLRTSNRFFLNCCMTIDFYMDSFLSSVMNCLNFFSISLENIPWTSFQKSLRKFARRLFHRLLQKFMFSEFLQIYSKLRS